MNTLARGLLSCFAAAAVPAQASAEPPRLVVHEWGTFTGVQGADGVGLEGLQHEEEALPAFVHDLRDLAALEDHGGGSRLKFPATRVTQKMETPVIYFHTEVPLRVWVAVEFRRGLLTQLYPIPDAVGPDLAALRAPVDLAEIRSSLAAWHLDLLPPGAAPPAEIPAVDRAQPWHEARQVRAAFVRTVPEAGRQVEAEHYVFYRGLGAFTMPVRVRAAGGGAAVVHNGCSQPVPFAVALEVGDRGARFAVLGELPAGEDRPARLDTAVFDANAGAVAARVGHEVMQALIAAGLHQDEARAMVATWSRQWFYSRGSRIVYVVPPAEVERVLPLRVSAWPLAAIDPDYIVLPPGIGELEEQRPPVAVDQVRVLVGRLEYVTPEVGAATERALRDSIGGDAAARTAATAFLDRLDRFLEPHLREVLRTTADPTVRRRAAELLAAPDVGMARQDRR